VFDFIFLLKLSRIFLVELGTLRYIVQLFMKLFSKRKYRDITKKSRLWKEDFVDFYLLYQVSYEHWMAQLERTKLSIQI